MNEQILNISGYMMNSNKPEKHKTIIAKIDRFRDKINAREVTRNTLSKNNTTITQKNMAEVIEKIVALLEKSKIDIVYIGRFETVYTKALKNRLTVAGISGLYA